MSGVRRLTIAVALMLAVPLFVAGCGDDGTATTVGLQRTPPLDVATVSLPDVTTVDAGEPFAFKAAPGELLVAYFGFTNCPDLCPTTLADLRSARRRIGEDAEAIDLAVVTVDPERDTPEILRNYVGSFAEKFHVLRTMDTAQLSAAESAFLASSSVNQQPDGTVEVSHTAATYVIDENGKILIEWPFGIGAEGMTNDLKILLSNLKEQAS